MTTTGREHRESIKRLIYLQIAVRRWRRRSAARRSEGSGRARRNGRARVILRQKPRDSSSPLIGSSRLRWWLRDPQDHFFLFFFCKISSTPHAVVIDPRRRRRSCFRHRLLPRFSITCYFCLSLFIYLFPFLFQSHCFPFFLFTLLLTFCFSSHVHVYATNSKKGAQFFLFLSFFFFSSNLACKSNSFAKHVSPQPSAERPSRTVGWL